MLPLTYVFEFGHLNAAMRPYILHEFAANGAEHIVFGEYFLGQILGDPSQEKTIAKEMSTPKITAAATEDLFLRKRRIESLK